MSRKRKKNNDARAAAAASPSAERIETAMERDRDEVHDGGEAAGAAGAENKSD